MTPQGTEANGDRFITVHDKAGQEYRVRMNRKNIVVGCKKLSTTIRVIGGHTIDLGIKRFKRSGATNKQVAEYKRKAYAELHKVHQPYVEKTARFEGLKFAKGVTVR